MMIQVDERFEINDGLKSVLVNELTGSANLVNHSLLDSLFEEFETREDKYWLNGRGKVAYLEFLTTFLKKEEKFFGGSQKKINKSYGRYAVFCNQNIIHAVLSSFLSGEPLVFIHPKHFEAIKGGMVGNQPANTPDYIPEFELATKTNRLPV